MRIEYVPFEVKETVFVGVASRDFMLSLGYKPVSSLVYLKSTVVDEVYVDGYDIHRNDVSTLMEILTECKRHYEV